MRRRVGLPRAPGGVWRSPRRRSPSAGRDAELLDVQARLHGDLTGAGRRPGGRGGSGAGG